MIDIDAKDAEIARLVMQINLMISARVDAENAVFKEQSRKAAAYAYRQNKILRAIENGREREAWDNAAIPYSDL